MFNFLRNQLKSVIEWQSTQPDIVIQQYDNQQGEIQNASKLILAPGQGAVLLYQGAIQSILDTEGIYELKTDNHPFITSLLMYRREGKNENQLSIYFYKKTKMLDLPWGTATPIKYHDKHHDVPVELGLFGNFSLQIDNISLIFNDILGVNTQVKVAEFQKIALTKLLSVLSSYLANQQINIMEIDANLQSINAEIYPLFNTFLNENGLKLVDFNINGSNIDPQTKQRLAQIADAKTQQKTNEIFGVSYVENERLGALRDLARNEGANSAALQLGTGLELGKQLLSAAQTQDQAEITASKETMEQITEKLLAIKNLFDAGVLSEAEYENTKKELLKKISE